MEFAASVIAVVQLAGKIAEICGRYINEVRYANQDIIRFQQQIKSLEEVLQSLRNLLDDPNCSDLTNTQNLAGAVFQCLSTLEDLKEKIDPESTRSRMRRRLAIGLCSAFGWPLDHHEVAEAIRSIEQYRSCFSLALQIDQM